MPDAPHYHNNENFIKHCVNYAGGKYTSKLYILNSQSCQCSVVPRDPVRENGGNLAKVTG